MARSIECKCDYNFTCGYCLRNAKPWVYTPSTSAYYFSNCNDSAIERDKQLAKQIQTEVR